jgi:hypothetical protein
VGKFVKNCRELLGVLIQGSTERKFRQNNNKGRPGWWFQRWSFLVVVFFVLIVLIVFRAKKSFIINVLQA